jgi:hypothetical protein
MTSDFVIPETTLVKQFSERHRLQTRNEEPNGVVAKLVGDLLDYMLECRTLLGLLIGFLMSP